MVQLELTKQQVKQLQHVIIQSSGFNKVVFKDESDLTQSEQAFSEMVDIVISKAKD